LRDASDGPEFQHYPPNCSLKSMRGHMILSSLEEEDQKKWIARLTKEELYQEKQNVGAL
jgi:hypothetical protein